MRELNLETIKIKLSYTVIEGNGYPDMKITLDEKLITSWIAHDDNDIEFSANLDTGAHVLRIHQLSKNHKTDGFRAFELQKIYVNDADLKHNIHNFVQWPELPRWEKTGKQEQWKDNLHLGHNGYLELNFSTPIQEWFKKIFRWGKPVKGQHSSFDGIKEAREKLKRLC